MLSICNRFASGILVFVLSMCVISGCMRCDEQLDAGDPVIAGWKHFQLGEFDQAVAEFESVCNGTSEKSDSLPDATYGLAAVWDLRM